MVLCSLLLVGCDETCAHPAGCDAPAEDTDLPDTDTDLPDTDTDTDTDPPCTDTGLGQLYISGSIQTRGGEFEAATVGYSVYGAAIDDWACVIEGSVAYEDPAPEGCPDCDWAFDLGPVEGAVATGPRCDTIGLADGTVNGLFDYSWGFADHYEYDYNGTLFTFDETLFLYIDGYDWFAFAFNYGGSTEVHGGAEGLAFVRTVADYYYDVPC